MTSGMKSTWLPDGLNSENVPLTWLVHGKNRCFRVDGVVKRQHADAEFHEAGQWELVEELNNFDLGIGADNGPHFRIVKGKGVVDQFAIPEKFVDFCSLVGDKPEKIFRENLG